MSTAVRTYSRGRKLVAMRDVPAGNSRYYHYDHQGTTQCLTDGTGTVTDRFASDAWGVQVKRTGSSINRQWYVGDGGYYRQSQWMDYVRMRYLAVASGRWTSRDPVRGQPWYVYASSSPVTFVDPSGEVPSGSSTRRKKCFVLSVLGRTQRTPDPTALVDRLHAALRLRGFKGYLSESEVGSVERRNYSGDTLTKNEEIKDILYGWYTRSKKNKRQDCECICFIGYSWGGGQVVDAAAWMFRHYPLIRQPAAVTIDAIQVTPARPEGRSTAVATRIPTVWFHGHWHAQFGYPFRNWVKGANIPYPRPGFSTLVPKSDHITIQDLTKPYAGPLFGAIMSIITHRCEMTLPRCCPDAA